MSEILQGHGAVALANGVKASYNAGQNDYSIDPLIIVDSDGKPSGRISDGDTVIFCCRRGEREVQLTEAFTEVGFDRFPRNEFKNLNFVTLTLYHDKFVNLPVVFGPTTQGDTLGEIVSRAKLRQLRVAESEKIAHVTYFFNGGNISTFPGQENICVPSQKKLPPEQVPELNLGKITTEVIGGINQGFDLIVTNFANGDVIGHTHNRQAKIKSAEFVDESLGEVIQAGLDAGYLIMVTADHGNLEVMAAHDGKTNGSHTTSKVPFLVIDSSMDHPIGLRDGRLADIAPTITSALGLPQPAAMTGVNLTPDHNWGRSRQVLLIILDGWGIGKDDETNPIFMAQTPFWDHLTSQYPPAQLEASGIAVGLQAGKAGNSEAGHMNIGAGRVVIQDDTRLDMAMQDGSFFDNQTLIQALNNVKNQDTRLHLIGLLSKRSSHGSIDYPLAILKMAKAKGLEEVYIHLIFDGRSTEPGSAPMMLEKLEKQVEEIGIGRIVSGIGRGFALDRDGNYTKTQRTYDAFVHGAGKFCSIN